MKITSSWIQDRLRRTMLNDAQIVQALERAGIEVEHVNLSSEIDKRVVIALTKKVIQHPQADRLKIVFTQVGDEEFQVVCGAPNVREGLKVAFAQIGATLPVGTRIEKAKLRGEISEGMLCSSRELGLGDDHSGLLELPDDAVVGSPLSDLYPADAVIDVKTPANRFDVQSIVGLAREIAAMTEAEATPLVSLKTPIAQSEVVISGQIEARRYMIARIEVAGGGAPDPVLAARLRAVGIRSISPIVDVTNYVLMDIGQPLHAFDAAKVALPLSVRLAGAGETLETLDGVVRELSDDDLVIADASGPIALAGVMGGKSTEVTDTTTEILLEAGIFDAVRIRKTAQRHGLRTEASSRYERGIATALPEYGLERAIQLLGQTASGHVVGIYEAPHRTADATTIKLELKMLNKLLGFVISHNEVIAALAKLGIESVIKDSPGETSNGGVLVAMVPWWRPDLKVAEDLVEEVVRVVGYDRVPATIPAWRPQELQFDHDRARRNLVRDLVWAAGGFEVITYSFVSAQQLESAGLDSEAHLKLKNPLSSEQTYLRSTMMPSHLTVLARNRLYASTMTFYEISKVFLRRDEPELPNEPLRLAVTVLEPVAVYPVAKGLLDRLATGLGLELEIRPANRWAFADGRFGEVWLKGTMVGGIGQIDPRVLRGEKIDGEAGYFELNLEPLLEMAELPEYRPINPYPSMTRDISLLVPMGVSWGEIHSLTMDWRVSYVGDYYSDALPVGMRGLTIRVELALPDRTPTEAQAMKLEEQVLARLNEKLGIVRRD